MVSCVVCKQNGFSPEFVFGFCVVEVTACVQE